MRYQIGFSSITLGGYDATGGLEGTSASDAGEATHLRVAAGSGASSTGLRAWSSVDYNKQDLFGTSETYSSTASAGATAVWNDFMVAGPGSGVVPVSINLHLDGFILLAGVGTPSGSFPATATGGVSVGVFVSGSNVGSGQFNQSAQNGEITTERNGILSTFDGDGVIQTPSFNVPVNTPFTLELSLGVNSVVVVAANQLAILGASTDFGNTLTFATEGAAFNLPAGYTVNSAEANISNNAVVPEPSTLLLTLVALPLWQLCRRRSREGHRRSARA